MRRVLGTKSMQRDKQMMNMLLLKARSEVGKRAAIWELILEEYAAFPCITWLGETRVMVGMRLCGSGFKILSYGKLPTLPVSAVEAAAEGKTWRVGRWSS